MLAEEKLREGNLDEALSSLQEAVRENPADAKHRVFLFQLLAVLGQWDRALTQLNTAAELDASTLAMAQMYREALRCEVLRIEVFSGKRSPMIFGEPPEWVGLLVEALRHTALGEHEAAGSLRDRALEAAPATAGIINGQRFGWFADADSRLGPVVEAIVEGKYFWIPVENIRRITVEEPADLRDLVWMPAQFTWANGGQMVGLISTRYPQSEQSDDDLIRLARKTEWMEVGTNAYLGLGQRMWATDADDFPLMDTKSIDFSTPEDTPLDARQATSPE